MILPIISDENVVDSSDSNSRSSYQETSSNNKKQSSSPLKNAIINSINTSSEMNAKISESSEYISGEEEVFTDREQEFENGFNCG